MSVVIPFDDPDGQKIELVGGKGANLGRLAAGGLPVPGGFTVSTEAYVRFGAEIDLQGKADEALRGLDFGDADAVDAAAAKIREAIVAGTVPEEIDAAVRAAYAEFSDGEDAYVAVRSSGTAEDLAEGSFAGLHDTYLDVRGADAVLDAVRRCWASLWTARAVAYRENKGFGHGVQLAVVIQRMVESDVSGVMFTANPLTAATDEFVINASWGLGESIVSGIVTPDELILDRESLKVRRSTLGTKLVRIVRDPDSGQGTVTEDVSPTEQREDSLTEAQAGELGLLGRRVTEAYEGLPQDIEWALADGDFYVLQARPITGVEFSWDEDLEYWQAVPEDPEAIYGIGFTSDFSLGAISPLMYTMRIKELSDGHQAAAALYGNREIAKMRVFKYHRAEAYYSCSMERALVPKQNPKLLRGPGALNKLPPSWWKEVEEAPFSWREYLTTYGRIMALQPEAGPYGYLKSFGKRMTGEEGREEAAGMTADELRLVSDAAVRREIDRGMELWLEADEELWGAFFLYCPFFLGMLGVLLAKWYPGDTQAAFIDLTSGMDVQTITLKENHEMWEFGRRIKNDEVLKGVFDEHEGEAFFSELENHEEGREFLADFGPWRVRRGHRGSSDRDHWYARRENDLSLDYNSFRALMGSDVDPMAREEEHRETRRRREEEVYAAIMRQPLGGFKLEIFKVVQDWCVKFMVFRDEEREYLDLIATAIKRSVEEMGRRLADRGQIDDYMDVHFLGLHENYDLLGGRASEPLCRAKIVGRKANFMLRHNKEHNLPPYIHRDSTAALPGEGVGSIPEVAQTSEDGRTVLAGIGTSSGVVTGRARVVKSLDEIGTLEKDDILICNSTDPGWTPVFLVISGLILETGGILAHGSCLSREYGLPAAIVAKAMSRVPDGATVTIDGDLGTVTVVGEPDAAPAATGELVEV
jgi:rifampicin phosphotransferase